MNDLADAAARVRGWLAEWEPGDAFAGVADVRVNHVRTRGPDGVGKFDFHVMLDVAMTGRASRPLSVFFRWDLESLAGATDREAAAIRATLMKFLAGAIRSRLEGEGE